MNTTESPLSPRSRSSDFSFSAFPTTAESPPVLLEARHISRSWGADTILEDVSLQVRAGESTAIVGPSGSGKTTLLGILALLLQPLSGHVLVGGHEATTLSDAGRAFLRNTFFGFVFQTAQLVGSLSVLDNVLIPALLAGRAARDCGRVRELRESRDHARALLARLGLASRAAHLPHMLSHGQRRRVAIARALLLRPAVVLADEPTNDLDPRRAEEVADFLLGLPAEGHALVLVTHDPELAARADNRWRLEAGQLRPASSVEATFPNRPAQPETISAYTLQKS
ncbi:ABC-type antimicrobial peptide transport system, ATPase component [Opitutaceae bacterium TAV1]|nr:ABC-type antimicrobial peptide transport system, ATPase component [Opitutaceae bacterium TAV1]